MRRPEVEKERDMRPAPFRSSKIWSTWRWRICSFHPKRVIQRKSMCDPQKSLHIAAAALLQQLSDMHPVLGHPALLQKTLQAMITDWTVFDQPFFLCKQNFSKLVVCAGKAQHTDVLTHQKILAGMCVSLHLRLLSSTILSPKRYTKNRPRLYNEIDLGSVDKKDTLNANTEPDYSRIATKLIIS